MSLIKWICFSALITLSLIDCINGEYLISRSELDEACSLSVRLFSSGFKDDQIEPIVIHKLLNFKRNNYRQSEPVRTLSPEFTHSDTRNRAGAALPVSQTGTTNFNVGSFIAATINLLNCFGAGAGRKCAPMNEFCGYMNFPDQIDLDNQEQINFLSQQIRLKKEFVHRCDLELLSAPLRINNQY